MRREVKTKENKTEHRGRKTEERVSRRKRQESLARLSVERN